MEARIIVVAADFGSTGDEAIRVGLEQLAVGTAQGMHVVYVQDDLHALLPAEEPDSSLAHSPALMAESLARRVRSIAERERLPYHAALIKVEVRRGDIVDQLIGAAREHRAQLLIISTHGRQGIERWLAGSVAESLIRSAECSVLVARPAQRAAARPDREPAERDDGARREDDAALIAELQEQASAGEKPWRPADEYSKHASS